MAGGIREGHELKFWTPGGSSTPLLTAEHLDVPLDYEGVAEAGSMLGTKALQIFDDSTCVVRAVARWVEFYKHESCGKCTPCREGFWWLVQILDRLEEGHGTEADLEKLLDLSDNIAGRSFCALADGGIAPVTSSLQYFRDEYVAHFDRRLPVRSGRLDTVRPERGGDQMTVTSNPQPATGSVEPGAEARHADHRRLRGERARRDVAHPGRGTARHPDPAVLRPPAARSRRRMPPVSGRGRRCGQRAWDAQTAGLVHHDRRSREWWSAPSSPRRSRTRPSKGSWNSC